MIGVCAGYFRPEFFFREMIILRESNSYARRDAYIPRMGSKLQTSHKDDLTPSREAAKQKKRKRRTSGDQAGWFK
jgi:hypothetical protein